jgi:hypothetical protein
MKTIRPLAAIVSGLFLSGPTFAAEPDRTVLPIKEPRHQTTDVLDVRNHHVNNMAGTFDRWPHRQGFDKFYGFLGGETSHWAPFI